MPPARSTRGGTSGHFALRTGCDAALIRRPATASRSRRVHSETPVPAGAAQRSQLRRRGVARLRRLARLTSLVWVAALALLVWGAAPAPAQCWCEDQHGGAGSLPQTAQKTLGSGPLTCIVGRLRSNAIADGGPDLEDMYLLRIDQPGIFTARTVVAPMPPAQPGDVVAFDTQLWLFQVCGDGLLGNDDDPCERAIGFSFIGNASNDGTGVIVKEPGLYLIAVSVHDNDPVSPLGPIFDQASRIEISGPDGLGGGVPISGWSRTAGGVPTDVDLWYRIDLTGCAYAAPFLCPADLNDDGIVDGADLGILLGNWGTMGVGDIDMDGDIDGADLGLLLGGFGFCPPPEGVCGEPNSGSCFEAHGNPACEDACCCEVVCAVDPFCCNVSWDSICAGGAGALCGEGLSDGAVGADGSGADADDAAGGGCLTSCPPCSIPEGEPCGADFNGGCNAFPPVFSAIACQDVICGDAWASGGTRDTDWYELQLADATEITFTVFGTLPMVIGLVNTGGVPDCNLATALNPFAVAPFCGTATLTVCLEPGTWWLFAAPNTFDGFPCGSQNLYWIKLECAGPCAPPSVCEGADHPCGTTGGPGCSDVACCTLVCSIDPFCCEVAWDLLCVIQAQELCVPPGVPNDNCANALPIALGATAFSTVGATTDGPDLPMMCEEGFGLTFVNDIWYVFTATQTGNLTVSTCGTANYDTRLAAYQGAGCFGPIVACNDDGPGCPGFTSLMVVPTTVGQPYLIRIGGFGGSGSGTVSLSY